MNTRWEIINNTGEISLKIRFKQIVEENQQDTFNTIPPVICTPNGENEVIIKQENKEINQINNPNLESICNSDNNTKSYEDYKIIQPINNINEKILSNNNESVLKEKIITEDEEHESISNSHSILVSNSQLSISDSETDDDNDRLPSVIITKANHKR